MTSKIRVKFYGVRALIPSPGKHTVNIGGNTPCILLEFDDTKVIIDAGTGIRNLGAEIVNNWLAPYTINLFITHTHWDHIQGFPFFPPIYQKNVKFNIYGPANFSDNFEKIFTGQMNNVYFPVDFKSLNASFNFHELTHTEFNLTDDIKVKTLDLNHTILSLGYRFEYKGKSIVTFYDFEPVESLFDENHDKTGLLKAKESIKKFLLNADLVIHDATYLDKDYYKGCGHSSISFAISNCQNANVKKLCLFHYAPDYSDKTLENVQKELLNKDINGLQVIFSREGKNIIL